MRGQQRLKPEQRTEFVQKGYLIIPGRLSLGMVDELLKALEWTDGRSTGKGYPPEVDGVN